MSKCKSNLSNWRCAASLIAILLIALSVRAAEAPVKETPKAEETAKTKTVVEVGKEAPAFTLKDIEGKAKSLADYRGLNVPVYFFCGCRLCHKCALAWSEIQRSGALADSKASDAKAGKDKKMPPTLVIYHGDATEARTFAEDTHLDVQQNVLLCDADEKVTQVYGATLCPRVFVVQRDGNLFYTNNEQGEDSYKIPAPQIVARTVDALRRAAEVKTDSNKPTSQPK